VCDKDACDDPEDVREANPVAGAETVDEEDTAPNECVAPPETADEDWPADGRWLALAAVEVTVMVVDDVACGEVTAPDDAVAELTCDADSLPAARVTEALDAVTETT